MVISVRQVTNNFDLELDTLKYEVETQAIATQLLAGTSQNSLWGKLTQLKDELRLDDKLMAWTMAHPGLRVQLFRLIDCLPALQSQAEIARHMQEYLASDAIEIPALKSLLSFSTDNPNSPSALAAAKTLSTAVSTLAKRYICGENLEAASKSIERLRRDRMAFTLDLLGEAVISETEAQNYLDRCIAMMVNLTDRFPNGDATRTRQWQQVESIPQCGRSADDLADGEVLPKVQISVKLSSLYSQFDPIDPLTTTDRVSNPVRQLLRTAKELGCGIHFDMEQYEFKSLTLAILKQILTEDEFSDRTDIGITLQAYLRESDR